MTTDELKKAIGDLIHDKSDIDLDLCGNEIEASVCNCESLADKIIELVFEEIDAPLEMASGGCWLDDYDKEARK